MVIRPCMASYHIVAKLSVDAGMGVFNSYITLPTPVPAKT